MKTISIEGERFPADLIGLTPNGRVACLGFIGRRAGVERALVALHKGANVYMGNQALTSLGEKAYKALRVPQQGLNRLFRVYIIPSTAVHHVNVRPAGKKGTKEDDNDVEGGEKVLLWRESENLDEGETLWSWLQSQTAIPVMQDWREPVLKRLSAMRSEQKADEESAESRTQEAPLAIQPLRFEAAGDGRWRGAVINVTDDMMARAVHAAITAGEAELPDV